MPFLPAQQSGAQFRRCRRYSPARRCQESATDRLRPKKKIARAQSVRRRRQRSLSRSQQQTLEEGMSRKRRSRSETKRREEKGSETQRSSAQAQAQAQVQLSAAQLRSSSGADRKESGWGCCCPSLPPSIQVVAPRTLARRLPSRDLSRRVAIPSLTM